MNLLSEITFNMYWVYSLFSLIVARRRYVLAASNSFKGRETLKGKCKLWSISALISRKSCLSCRRRPSLSTLYKKRQRSPTLVLPWLLGLLNKIPPLRQ